MGLGTYVVVFVIGWARLARDIIVSTILCIVLVQELVPSVQIAVSRTNAKTPWHARFVG